MCDISDSCEGHRHCVVASIRGKQRADLSDDVSVGWRFRDPVQRFVDRAEDAKVWGEDPRVEGVDCGRNALSGRVLLMCVRAHSRSQAFHFSMKHVLLLT